MRDRERERLGQVGHGPQQPLLAVVETQDVLLGGGQERTAAPVAVPDVQRDQSKPWKRPRQISYFSSITATASAWSIAVSPVPPLSV